MKKIVELLKKYKIELFVVLFFIVVHLPSLGMDNFNTDVWKWKKRIYDFSNGVFYLKPEETVQTYHPGVTLMWLGTIAVKFYNLSKDLFNSGMNYSDLQEIFYLDFTQKLFVVMGIAVGLLALLIGVTKILGKKASIIFGLLLTIEPFYLALTRVIHLEGLTSTFLLASIVWIYVWGIERKRYTLFISALFGALAVLTKTSAVFILPFAFFYILLITKHPKDILKWLGFFVATALVMWPALLFRPIYVANYLYSGVSEIGIEDGHEQFYFGKYVTDPGWTFYFVSIAYRSSPAVFIGFFLSLLFVFKLTDNRKKFVLFLLSFMFLYMLEITLPTKKLDRYVLPVLMGMILVFSAVLSFLFEKIEQRKTLGLLLISVLSTVYIDFNIHPIYFNYYSPLFGGIAKGIYVIEPKWLIGTKEIIAYFSELKTKEGLKDFAPNENIENLLYSPLLSEKLTVAFPEKYYTQIHPFVRQIGGWAVIEDLSGQAVKTRYFVYPVWDDYSNRETRFKLAYFGDIKVQGIPVYKVYERVR